MASKKWSERKEPIDTLFSYGLEIERQFENQWAASFAIESRQYEAEGAYPNIRGNQMYTDVYIHLCICAEMEIRRCAHLDNLIDTPARIGDRHGRHQR